MPKKICKTCGKEKPISEFGRQSYTGLPTSDCKVCTSVKRNVKRNKSKHGKFISKERIRGMEEPQFTLDDWRKVLLYFEGHCAFCGDTHTSKLDRDHLIAISKGGKTVAGNIIPACTKCNRGRGNADWRVWFRKQPFWSQDKEEHIAQWVRENYREECQ